MKQSYLLMSAVAALLTVASITVMADINMKMMPSYQTNAGVLVNGSGIQNGVPNDCPLCRARAALNANLSQLANRGTVAPAANTTTAPIEKADGTR